LIVSLALVLPLAASAQKITSLQTSAKGEGTLNISDIDKHKITSVLVILKENGEAELTFYTDLQLSAKGTWSVGKTLSQGIDLKITGGIANAGGTGTGKLLLRKDGKSIKKLTITGTSADGSKVSVDFTANNPPSKPQ
jgi:hypothetical protein